MTEREPGEGGGFSWGLTPSGAEPGGAKPDAAPTPESEVAPPAEPETGVTPAPTVEPEATQLMPQLTEPAAPEPAPLPRRRELRSDPALDPAPGHAPAAAPPSSDSPIDALFGESQFREYEAGLLPVAAPPPGRPAASTPVAPPLAQAARVSGTQKLLLGILGGLLAALILVALFFVGTRLPTLTAAAPALATSSATPTRTATPTPTPTAAAVGPVGPGIHRWDTLRGGECLDPYASPWAETFTVVDCGTPHPAQLVFRGSFTASPASPASPAATPAPTAAALPGAAALQAQISLLCAAPGVLDLAAAGQYSDAQVQGSYPVTAAQWDSGERDYFCFISRSSGQPLTGSVAAARAPEITAP